MNSWPKSYLLAARPVSYNHLGRNDYVKAKMKLGLPAVAAEFAMDWGDAAGAGEFEEASPALQELLKESHIAHKIF